MIKKSPKDFYLEYPHKCQLVINNVVKLPYVKQKDLDCDSKYSLSYAEWILIFNTYAEVVLQYLATGQYFKLPYRMGKLRLEVLKDHNPKIPTNMKERGKSKILGRDSIFIRWYRQKKDGGLFTNKWKWRVRLSKKAWRDTVEYFANNRSKLKNLNQMINHATETN